MSETFVNYKGPVLLFDPAPSRLRLRTIFSVVKVVSRKNVIQYGLHPRVTKNLVVMCSLFDNISYQPSILFSRNLCSYYS